MSGRGRGVKEGKGGDERERREERGVMGGNLPLPTKCDRRPCV